MYKKRAVKNTSSWKSFYSNQLKKHWLAYFAGVGCVMLTNITEVLIPKFTQWAIDLVSGSQENLPSLFKNSNNPLAALSFALLLNILLAFFTRAGWRIFLAKRTFYSARKIRKEMWKSLSHQNLSVFSKFPMGDLLNRNITDINPARFILGFTLVMTSDIVFFVVFGFLFMFFIHPLIALSVLVTFVFLPVFVYPILKEEYDLHNRAQESLSVLSDSISQFLGSIRLQRITGMEKTWVDRLTEESKEYSKKQYKLERTAWKVFPISNINILVSYVFIVGFGLYEMKENSLTSGEFVALISLVSLISGPVTEIASNILEWQKGASSLDRICEIIELESDDPNHRSESSSLTSVDNFKLELKNLTFSFTPNSPPILNGINLSIKQGESLGVVGRVGSGKTTLLNLIAGIDKSDSNSIFIGNRAINSLNRKEITSLVSYVSQVPFLFAGSVRENLCLESEFSDQELWEVLRATALYDEIKSYESGLDTQIGEWGISLSGGQKQRLALARNLLRPRPIMLFDDCLSAVDTATEKHVQASIEKISDNSILIWVAHRESTVKNCDKVVEIVDGRLKNV